LKKNYRIAPEVREQILKRIKEEGVSVSQAVKDHGIHDTTIYGWARGPAQALTDPWWPSAHSNARGAPLDKRHGGNTILTGVGAKIHGEWQDYSWRSRPFERSAAMDTPPCSSARRVGWFPSGAHAVTPSGGREPAGGFCCVLAPSRQAMTRQA
jgi:transposase-like protein